MASFRCLRADARLTILRGVQALRAIELVRQLAEEQQLAERQEQAALFDALEDGEWVPSPEEIEAACSAIQAEWTDDDREQRWRPDRINSMVRQNRALHPGQHAAYNREYWKNNPDYAERQRQAGRQWKAEHQPQQKEWQHAYRAANRDRINAWKRAYRLKNLERMRADKRAWHAANKDRVNAAIREAHADPVKRAEIRAAANRRRKARKAAAACA